jgi:transcriptional regulator with XRE-family HTH domain
MTIGERIRHYREQAGMTQDDLAEVLGITHSAISLIENDKRGVSLDNLYKIIQALDIKFTDILPEYKE